MTFFTKIKSGISNPREALKFIILGKKNYHLLQNINNRSCLLKISPISYLESRMMSPSDINEHLITLNMLTIELKLKRILELGTRTGESTIAFLEAAKLIDGVVTSIDVDPCLDAKKLVSKIGLSDFWNFIQNDDLQIDWKEPIDHLFIDTSHTYDQTLAELQKFVKYVRPGGIVSLHDIISHPEVLSAIQEYIKDKHNIKFYKYFNNSGLGILWISE